MPLPVEVASHLLCWRRRRNEAAHDGDGRALLAVAVLSRRHPSYSQPEGADPVARVTYVAAELTCPRNDHLGLQNKSPSQSWVLARAHVTETSKPRSHVPAQVPSDNNIQLVLSDWQARQTVIAVVAPSKPDERSVRRWPSGVVINAAVPAIELHDREVCARWSGSHKAERQCTNCEEDFLHSP
jgi:hypothetical protein